MNGFTGERIQAGIVHAGRDGERRRIEILDLLRTVSILMEILRQLHHILQTAARMRCNEIRHRVEIFSLTVRFNIKIIHEPVEFRDLRFVHLRKHTRRNVLRRDTQMPADMVRDEIFHEFRILGSRLRQIRPDAGRNEDIPDPGNIPDLRKKIEVLAMARFQIRADLRVEAASAAAGFLRIRISAFRAVHIRSRTANVGDRASEMKVFRHAFRLGKDRFLRAALRHFAFMRTNGAERAAAIASADSLNGIADRLECGDPGIAVARMLTPGERKSVDSVHLFRRKRFCRRIHDDGFRSALLEKGSAAERIHFFADQFRHFCEFCLFRGDFFRRRKQNDIFRKTRGIHDIFARFVFHEKFRRSQPVRRPRDVSELGRRFTGIQSANDLEKRMFPHAEGEDVRLGIQKHTAAHFVAPIVVVCRTAQTRLNTAEDDRNTGERFSCPLAVDRRRAVRTHSDLSARSVRIHIPHLTIRRVVIHHRVHISGTHRKTEPRPSEFPPGIARFPVRLCENRDAETVSLKPSSQKCRRERGVIDVTVP